MNTARLHPPLGSADSGGVALPHPAATKAAMKILVACEYSGRVRGALRDCGHSAWSCDLLPAEDGSAHHVVGDVLAMLREPWDMVVAHPPCTRLCNSGVRWL